MNPVDIWQHYAAELANVVAPEIRDAGLQLWRGLALIVVVWTGTQMALSGGGVNMAAVVRLVISLAMPLGMLRFYSVPMPGVGLSVPDIITGMGNWLHGVIVSDAGERMLVELHMLMRAMWSNLMLNVNHEGVGLFDLIPAIIGMVFSMALGFVLWVLILIVMLVVYAVGLGQVVWAQLAIALAILLGPIFIPFLVLPPLSFLFWGWFKTLLTYSVYAAIAAAVFRITSQVGVQVLQSLGAPGPYATPAGAFTLLQHFLMTILFATASLMAALQVGQFASMLLSGSGTVASGVGHAGAGRARGCTATKGVM